MAIRYRKYEISSEILPDMDLLDSAWPGAPSEDPKTSQKSIRCRRWSHEPAEVQGQGGRRFFDRKWNYQKRTESRHTRGCLSIEWPRKHVANTHRSTAGARIACGAEGSSATPLLAILHCVSSPGPYPIASGIPGASGSPYTS
jgi:hypothetical protein